MKNEEILKKAIEKANEKGFDLKPPLFDLSPTTNTIHICTTHLSYKDIIFSHEFAKAFWGNGETWSGEYCCNIFNWEHHLQEMVLEEDPVSYLEKFL